MSISVFSTKKDPNQDLFLYLMPSVAGPGIAPGLGDYARVSPIP